MSGQKKHKQHYVWEHYLGAWATDGKLWCRDSGKRDPFHPSTENVGHKRDFYRLREMAPADKAFVALLAGRAEPPLGVLAQGWIKRFDEPFARRRQLEVEGAAETEQARLVDVEINNFEEDLHGAIESAAVPILEQLRNGVANFVVDHNAYGTFSRFIAAQYLRTRRIQAGSVYVLQDVPGVDPEAVWGVLRTVLTTNVSAAIFRGRQSLRVSFLETAESVEFITGDQPVVNARGTGGSEEPPAEFELYYPVSASRAVLIGFDAARPTIERRHVEQAEVRSWNAMIAARCFRQIYARSRSAIEDTPSGGS